MVAASAHTAVLVMAEALKTARSSDKDTLRQAIAATSLAAISFNALGEVKKDVQVQVVRAGGWHFHSTISDAVLLAPPTE